MTSLYLFHAFIGSTSNQDMLDIRAVLLVVTMAAVMRTSTAVIVRLSLNHVDAARCVIMKPGDIIADTEADCHTLTCLPSQKRIHPLRCH